MFTSTGKAKRKTERTLTKHRKIIMNLNFQLKKDLDLELLFSRTRIQENRRICLCEIMRDYYYDNARR